MKTRTRTKQYEVVTFENANKETRDKIREYISYYWDIYDICLDERLQTLKKVAEKLDGILDYSLSCVPDRGEFIKITPKYDELNFVKFWDVINQDKDCPFTGVCYDHDIIDHFTKYNLNENTLKEALSSYLDSIHKEYEFMLTDEYLIEYCEANEYEFYVDNGRLY